MKVILKTRVQNLGYKWDIVTVKNGYARNFLIPQKLAEPATPALIKKAEKLIEERMKKLEEVIAKAKEIAEKLKGIELLYTMKAKEDKLYGSIAEKDIVDSIKADHKIEINKDMVDMKDHIKTIGSHKVKIKLAEGVTAQISVKVEAE